MKAPEMRKFRMLLHRRGMTINGVCAAAGVGRSHGSQVLNGKPGRGFWTRRKLARWLREEELEALGWVVIGGNVSTNLPEASSTGGRSQSGPEPARAGKVMVSARQPTGMAAPDSQGKSGEVRIRRTILDLERGEEGNGRKMGGRKMGRPQMTQMNADKTKNTKKENLE